MSRWPSSRRRSCFDARVRVVQVAGTSGAGKSSVFRHLRTGGHHAISTDSTEGLCRWVDRAGATVARPDSPSADWLAAHMWVWDLSRLESLIASLASDVGRGTLFVCGSSANDELARFEAIVLLDIDEATMVSRVRDPAGANDFGRFGDSLAVLVAELARVRSRYLDRGAIAVDATAPLSTVASAVLGSASPASGV